MHSDGYNRGRLFLLSVVALVAAGMVFSIRAATIGDIQGEFFDPIAPSSASEWIGFVAGVAFLSFAVSIFIGSPLCDYIGMRALLGVACVSHILGSIVVIFAGPISNVCNIQFGDKPSVYWILYLGMLIVGIGHGLVEAVINPLAATLYPEDKTHRLNVLHAWWPGGIIIGGVLAYLMGKCGATWQVKQALVLIPACWYGYLLV
ncbi:MAG: MFS transporter, partial [Armatimonadota bacterium]